MPDIIQLSCLSCGAKLKVTNEIDRFVCSNCGAEFLVRRGDGTVSPKPSVQELSDILVENQRTSSELALVRLRPELIEFQAKLKLLRSDAEKEAVLQTIAVQDAQDLILWAGFIVFLGIIALYSFPPFGMFLLVAGIIFVVLARKNVQMQKGKHKSAFAIHEARIAKFQAQVTDKQKEVDLHVRTVSRQSGTRQ